MGWTKHIEQAPTIKDMPFVCVDKFGMFSEVWDDSDYFMELDDNDRDEWVQWMHIAKP